MEALFRRTIGEDIRLSTDFPEGMGRVEMDRSQLEQIIINLVVNARQAMPRGGELLLSLDRISELDYPEMVRDGAPGRIRLTVRDTGVGMDAETRNRIFEPFFTTKSEEEGSGLGLSTVYGIVEQSGGAIEVESEEGLGTEFRILLPAHEEGEDG